MTTLKKPIFIGFGGLFHFICFSFFLFLVLQHKKDKKTKNAIFISKTSFLTSPKFCKNTILAQCDTICVYKHTKKHYKNGETVKKKLGPVFNFKLGSIFNLKPPNLGPLFNFTAYIYIYVCVKWNESYQRVVVKLQAQKNDVTKRRTISLLLCKMWAFAELRGFSLSQILPERNIDICQRGLTRELSPWDWTPKPPIKG